tara:strand:- start:6087 stop:8960 length:2874 start_codon:yes stop_codon:yes gene_type:complete
MAKSAKTLNRFDAGLVAGPNPRDISDEAASILEGFDPSKIGALQPVGQYIDAVTPGFEKIFATILGVDEGSGAREGYGYGLFQFRSDKTNLVKHLPLAMHNTTGVHSPLVNADANYANWEALNGDIVYTILIGAMGTMDAGEQAGTSAGDVATGPHLFVHYHNLNDGSDALNGWHTLNYFKSTGIWKTCSQPWFAGQAVTAADTVNSGTIESDTGAGDHRTDLSYTADLAYSDSNDFNQELLIGGEASFYKPKFLLIDGAVHIYDSSKYHAPFYIGYVQNGITANVEDVNAQIYWKSDYWHFGRNLFSKPRKNGYGTLQNAGSSSARNITNDGQYWYLNNFTTSTNWSTIDSDDLGGTSCKCWPGGGIVSTRWTANEDGGWTKAGNIKIGLCYVYDKDQEGPITFYNSASEPGENNGPTSETSQLQLSFAWAGGYRLFAEQSTEGDYNLAGKHTEGGPRMTGMKAYYQYSEGAVDGDSANEGLFLLFHFDFEKGYRIAGTDTWNEIGSYSSHPRNSFSHVFMDPPTFEDFVTENGYLPGQEITANYATAVWHKARLFAGNIRQRGADYPDRILKSPIGKPDILPEDNFIDLTGSDAESIMHLEAEGDNLYVFKQRNLYVVDIATLDEEKLKEEFVGLGVPNYNHVVKTSEGICFANGSGVFLAKDAKITNLLVEEGVEKVELDDYRTMTGYDGTIQNPRGNLIYEPSNNKLIFIVNGRVGMSTSGNALIYHFGTKSWTLAKDVFPQSVASDKYACTNFILDWSNRILTAGNDAGTVMAAELATDASPNPGIGTDYNGCAETKLFLWKEFESDSTYAGTAIAQNSLNWSSKDFDLGTLGAKKSLKKLYITYRAHGTGDLHLHPKYTIDAGGTLYTFENNSKYSDRTADSSDTIGYTSAGGLKGTDGEFRTIELKPANKIEAKKFNTIKIHLTNSTGASPRTLLNVDDITMIYRTHTVK